MGRERGRWQAANAGPFFRPPSLPQVNELLSSDPSNAEYTDVREGLTEVIALTRDLFADAAAAGSEDNAPPPPPPPPARKRKSRWDTDEPVEVEAAAAPPPPPSSSAPPPLDVTTAPVAPRGNAPTARPAVSTAPMQLGELPKWLKAAPGDDARTKERKAKAAKAFKSKARFAKLDAAAARKAASWQSFKEAGVKKKKGLAKPVATKL